MVSTEADRITDMLAFLIWVLIQSAATPPPTASIEGVVLKLGATEPIAGAYVEAARSEGGVSFTSSGSDGKFLLHDLQPGTYRLVATKPATGLMPAEYGQRDGKGHAVSFTLTAGQKLTTIQMTMAPTAAISGRVIDHDGDPVANARVMALEAIYRNGHRTLNISRAVKTNDLGEYRLFWVPPGRYYIAVQADDQRNGAFSVFVPSPENIGTREDSSSPSISRRILEDGRTVEETAVTIYYGGGRDLDKALPVDLQPGMNVGAIDVSLIDSHVTAHRVRGIVIDGSTGQPAVNATIRLIPRVTGPHVIVPNALTDKKGAFDVAGVTPGAYQLFAIFLPRGGGVGGSMTSTFYDVSSGLTAVTPIEMNDRDIENISLLVKAGFTATGRVMVENNSSASADVDVRRFQIALARDPDILGMPGGTSPITGRSGAPAADGSFTLTGFGPGDYKVTVSGLPSTAFIKSIRWTGSEILERSVHFDNAPEGLLEVVVSLNSGTIEGTVTNDKNEPIAGATLALVPDTSLRQRFDLYRNVRSDASGHFKVEGVVPGDFKLFAWDSVESNAWEDPEFIRNYESRGVSVHVGEASKQSLQVTRIP